ncbi:hypothetical protein AKJ09_05205 [Labilithrix luteola]|uniref:Cytochrome c domain-containing protein n=1 Tax=Labilithrix luteola TaxID=1391654 RepID=A0A0K1PYS1_9BACT|nr:hypothetical protein [Labilithrix luteola]AKU98541.1 hypothetical protein AKJ09_05205 [Labilithrix luteola]
MKHRALGLMAFAALASLSSTASATPNFPSALQSDLGLASAPDCSLCHAGAPSSTTATTPFALSMRSAGLVAYDTGSLASALDKLEADGTDSDGDCVPDVTELRQGQDPNVSNGGSCGGGVSTASPPRYGCGATITPTRAPAWSAAFVLVALSLLVVRRRRN